MKQESAIGERDNGMENFIVRIYRRGGAEGLAGLIKSVETDEEKPFTDADELLGILGITPLSPRPKNANAKRSGKHAK